MLYATAKYEYQKIYFSVFALLILLVAAGGFLFSFPDSLVVAPVYAKEEDDGEKEYEEEDEDKGDDFAESSIPASSVKSVPIYKKVLVKKVITTLDPIFTVDQDRDAIVDGLDPHPATPEQEFFTDNDGDSVPNAFDRHLDEDDFAYYEEDTDSNGNGLTDSYESLAER